MNAVTLARFTDLRRLSVESVVDSLIHRGYAVIPRVITPVGLGLLNEESRTLRFLPDREELGKYSVKQDKMSSVCEFARGSLFLAFRDEFEDWLFRKMNAHDPILYAHPFHFNDVRVQKYDAGSTGIGIHRDNIHFVDLICAFTLSGGGSFVITKDREGNDPKRLESSPGTLILMRGHGFRGLGFGPFHFVDQIGDGRLSLALRIHKKSQK